MWGHKNANIFAVKKHSVEKMEASFRFHCPSEKSVGTHVKSVSIWHNYMRQKTFHFTDSWTNFLVKHLPIFTSTKIFLFFRSINHSHSIFIIHLHSRQSIIALHLLCALAKCKILNFEWNSWAFYWSLFERRRVKD